MHSAVFFQKLVPCIRSVILFKKCLLVLTCLCFQVNHNKGKLRFWSWYHARLLYDYGLVNLGWLGLGSIVVLWFVACKVIYIATITFIAIHLIPLLYFNLMQEFDFLITKTLMETEHCGELSWGTPFVTPGDFPDNTFKWY